MVYNFVHFSDGNDQLTHLATGQQLNAGLVWTRQTHQEGLARLDYEFR